MDSGLRVQGLHRKFGDLRAVDGVDLTVEPGSMVGFLGSNGAGKTTTMRMILGILQPDAGTIEWNGKPIDNEVRNTIGYMPQERGLYARMKVKEQVSYFGQLAGLDVSVADRRADEWIERVGLTERADDLLQELSGGNQQRVQLAVSLVHEPNLLILDEPFAGLDPVAADMMREILTDRAEQGAGILLSSHQLNVVEGMCDDVVIVSHGREVAAGTPIELRTSATTRVLKVAWSEPIESFEPRAGELVEFTGTSAVVELPALADMSEQIAHAVGAGDVAMLSVEPPSLAEIFAETVSSSASDTIEKDMEVAS